jgi:hypothetical protein
LARFVNAQVREVVQPFWVALQRGEFIADAAVAVGTYRKQGTRDQATRDRNELVIGANCSGTTPETRGRREAMATTTRSSNGRTSNGAGSRSRSSSKASSRGRSKRSSQGNARRNPNRTASSGSKSTTASVTERIGSTAKKAKTPLVAGGAAAAGLATGTALGLLRGSRRPRVLGMPMPRASEVKASAQKAFRAGRWIYDMETDLRLVREHAEQSRRQSPIEVLLSGLTTRALPRRR